MTILVLAEHQDTQLDEATAKAVSAAGRMGGDVHVLVAGSGCGAAAEAAARLEGVAKVLLADDPSLANRLAEPVAALVVSLAGGYDALLAPSTTSGKNIMPRVAALLDVMQISDVIAVEGPDLFQRPIYAGNVIQTVRSTDARKVLTVRVSSFPAAAVTAATRPIEAAAISADPARSSFVRSELSGSERPELTGARIVVSGGRALASAENFETVLAPLADRLGAAIGASRAAVDAGYVSNDLQVGQTGKIIAPDLYIACGISGAIQHLAGMKDSKVIVAINKDPEAPIFQVADYGLVADLFEAVPEFHATVAEKMRA
ncbi:electron transfer flavoprotein subunit alpha/FixB family protein [Aminobacter aganoensis]|uniref:Electron transfer flavoprotein subunit alpha n=1 Tax=Aminobacter aganoensis TaxID=83264 RepID=A0A7X0F6X7_9HYPH|nr:MULTISPECIES: FAD-binding protein [Aminobacter]KQU64173.1 electron transfer flavoprotein subunit beta [Aminobacter sp. DSM 101952]MBB6354292.1 electron transfer flavoprotein alpha subunit [Aminobacter aganoensis]